MAESRALDIFKTRKDNPIAPYVRLLTCFMSAIKDRTIKGKRDVFVAVEDTSILAWTDQQVADALKKLLKKGGPSAFRGASKPAQSLRTAEGVPFGLAVLKLVVWHPLFYLKQTAHCGWGLFARRNLTFAELQAALYGFLSPLDQETFTTLRDNGHPNLFATRNQRYILHELLSLVNHQCKSKVYFSRVEKPSDAVKEAATTPAFVVLDSNIRVLRIKSINPNHHGFLAGQEICVNYRRKPVTPCKCQSCVGAEVDADADANDADAVADEDELLTVSEDEHSSHKRQKHGDE